jgi:peroxiredoxin
MEGWQVSLSAVGIVLALIIAGVAVWLAYVVFLQCGRLLLRVEELETQIQVISAAARTRAEPEVMTEDWPSDPAATPGAIAPSFRLPRLDGGDLALEEYRGRRVLLVFSDPECKPCRGLMPRLEQLHRRSAMPAVIMVSRGEIDANQAMVAEFGLTFPIVLQPGWVTSREYGMVAAPIGYLIDARGAFEQARAVGTDAIMALAESAVQDKIEQEEVLLRN